MIWLLLAAAFAQSLADLDSAPPPAPLRLAWASPPAAAMVRRGGNGPGHVQYAIPGDPLAFGGYVAEAVRYEYVDRQLGTVVAVFDTAYDANGVATDLAAAYGPPTFADEHTRVWRGDKVRVAWRAQDDDVWTITWSWLPLHGGDDPIEPAPPASP